MSLHRLTAATKYRFIVKHTLSLQETQSLVGFETWALSK